jgi:hypothetical protein
MYTYHGKDDSLMVWQLISLGFRIKTVLLPVPFAKTPAGTEVLDTMLKVRKQLMVPEEGGKKK